MFVLIEIMGEIILDMILTLELLDWMQPRRECIIYCLAGTAIIGLVTAHIRSMGKYLKAML